MSNSKGVKIKYKGSTVYDMPGDGEIKLLTKESYLEDDIDIEVDRGVAIGSKSITANGSYSASSDDLDGYDEVTVNVPNTYAQSDEGKVVSNGALVSQTSITVTENDTYDTTLNNEVVVDVPIGGTLITKTITDNGTYNAQDDDADGYSEVVVDVEGGGDTIPSEYQKVDWVKTGSTFSCISAFGYDMRKNDVVEFYAQADDWTQTSSGKAYYAILGLKETLTSSSGARGWIGVDNTLEKAIFTQFATLYGDNLEYSKAAGSSYVKYDSVADSNAKVLLKFSPQADAVPRTLFVGGYGSTEYAQNTKIYKITVKRADGTLAMNLIPCYRKADSVVGMFETKTWRFIAASNGSFTCGTDS